ncbi:mitochondrial import receptor subunit TOM7-like protein [Dinothrombium tinctorium]|uniref:Mitochondrial import receptor subunit TOM7 homolog n=1 Tax=Dinothrombium tinctorium TaxID=1965070 RepID=A0A443R497_9ACAR|nr:mitochondrial import receptor subunit TOM7-like protein [Dinothrombium tinctorium]
MILTTTKVKSETRQRLATVLSVCRFSFQYGFIPFVIWLGFRKGADPGMPPLTWQSLLWQ